MIVKYQSEDGFEFDTEKQCTYYEQELKKYRVSPQPLINEKIGGYDANKINSLADLVCAIDKISTEEQKQFDKSKVYDVFSVVKFNHKSFPFYFIPELKISHIKLISRLNDELKGLQAERETLNSKILEIKDKIKSLKQK
jgi:hypothetical protein